MRLPDILQHATDFGTFHSRENFISFTLKTLLYIFPAVILGHYTDRFVKKLQDENRLGQNTLHYILLQTFIGILTLYLCIAFLSEFSSEFQVTVAGGYFTVLYFGLQTNYISMIQEYLR
jgi:hypothetical protein